MPYMKFTTYGTLVNSVAIRKTMRRNVIYRLVLRKKNHFRFPSPVFLNIMFSWNL